MEVRIYVSELFRPTVNHKITRAQIKLTRACALVAPGVDTQCIIRSSSSCLQITAVTD